MALIDSLEAYWKMDEASGDATDSSGNSKTLTNLTSVTYTTGLINNAAQNNGTTNRRLRSTGLYSTLSNATNKTWNFWMNITSFQTGDRYVGETYGTADNTRIIWYTNATDQKLHCWYGGNEVLSGVLSTSTWYMVSVVKTGTTIELFINTSSQGTVSKGVFGANTNIFAFLAAEAGGAPSSILIDEAGLWSVAQDSTAISELYNSGAGLSYPFGGGGFIKPNFKGFAGL